MKTDTSTEIEIDFVAVLVPGTTQASTQYVSVGVLYDSGNYLWVGQQKVVTSIQTRTFTNTAEVKAIPSTLVRGGHGLVETEIIITQPFSDLTISLFNPLGYEDTFHLGSPVKLLGGAFSCNEEAKWEVREGWSISRRSVGKMDLTYKNLINLDRDPLSTENKINIKIPITALSDAKLGQYAFTIGVQIGTETVVSNTQDITITDTTGSPGNTGPGNTGSTIGTSGTVQPLTPEVYPGGSAAFLISVTVPGDLTWELKVTGTIGHTAVGVFIDQTGLCAGFTSLYRKSSGNSYDADFGLLTNVDSSPTVVKVVVAFQVDSTASGSISEIVTIDGAQYSLTDTEIVASPTTVGDVSGTGQGLGPTSFTTKFGAGIRSVVNIPADIIEKSITFMTFPDGSVTDLDVKICRLEVESVGVGLPCLYPQQDPGVQAAVYSKSSDAKLFNDVGKLELGSTCPAAITSLAIQSPHHLQISFIYEIPSQTLSPGPYKLNGGIHVNTSSLWTASASLTTSSTELVGLEDWKTTHSTLPPYLTARTESDTVKAKEPFPVRFVLKINRNTRGRLQFTVKSGGNAAICGIKVKQIGRNLACAEKPEGFVDKYFKTDIGYVKRHELDGEGWLVFDGLTNYGSSELESNMYADDDSIEVTVIFTFVAEQTIVAKLNDVSKDVFITTSGEKDDSTGPLDFEFVKVPLSDDEKIYSKTPKTLGILIDVPVDFSGPVRIKFVDKDFSLVEFCSIKVTKVGGNLPCINQQQRAIFPDKTESSLVKLNDRGNPKAYKEIYLDLNVCHYQDSTSTEENKFQVEVTFRLAAEAAEGDTVTIEAVTIVGIDETSKESSLTVSLDVPSFVTISNTTYAEVLENSTTPIYAGCCQYFHSVVLLQSVPQVPGRWSGSPSIFLYPGTPRCRWRWPF